VPDTPHAAHRRVIEAAASAGERLEVVTFPQSTHTAAEAAATVSAELGQIVKSLVFVAPDGTGEGGSADGDGPPARREGLPVVVALVSGAHRVDVARLARLTGLPGLRRATAREASEATGFVIGGIPPFGHVRPVRVVMDPLLEGYPLVWAAAGTPNAVFAVTPDRLRDLSGAIVAPIAQEAPDGVPRAVGPAPSGA
jgi:prolyl-tRNA editing enzyme YbaK/EbsC (Cys-tRNA(Pro) deacylase)